MDADLDDLLRQHGLAPIDALRILAAAGVAPLVVLRTILTQAPKPGRR